MVPDSPAGHALAATEWRWRFIEQLSRGMRGLSDPTEVMQFAACALGQHLGVNRCAYARVHDDEDTFDVAGDYNDAVPSIVGRHRLADFGSRVVQLMRQNLPYVNPDVERDAATAGTDLRAYRTARIAALICVPLHKEGRFVAAMAVHHARPRAWTPEEVDLVQTVLDRCWETLDRLRREAQLKEANQRLSLALHAADLGDWSWDAATDLVSLSARACEIFGLPRAEPVTWSAMRDLLHPEDAECARVAVEEAIATRGTYSIEYRVRRQAGGWTWVAAQGKGVYAGDGAVQGMIGIVQDVTARRLEQEKAATEARMLEVLNRTGSALAAELDLQKLLQRVTDAATELTGAAFGAFFYNGTDERGESLMLYVLSGAARESFERLGHPRPTALFAPTFRGEPAIRIDDVLQDPRYGQWAPHHGMPAGHLPVRSYLAVPVLSRHSKVIGGLFFGHPQPGVFSERSARLAEGIASQAAIAIDNARLYAQAQEAAEERTRLLESERAARAEAERASSLKDDFLATLSHELRTPLSAIMGWVHILRRKLEGTHADLVKGVAVIERSTRIQLQLIEDLLDMSRITSGKLRLDAQAVAPSTFVQAALDVVRPAAESAGVAVHSSFEATPLVLGDAGRLQQAVWNLLVNAVKFTPRGGTIRVGLRTESERVRITVSDTGVGIRPEFLPVIFERFRQADGSTTRRFGGLGLGLSIVRHLVELHGGTVTVQSEGEGRGATFTIDLPTLDAGEGAVAKAASSYRLRGDELAGLRIVLAEDDRDARELLERVLGECGAQVRACAGAQAALAQLRLGQCDVLVSDIGMPGMDGYELVRRARRLEGGQPRACIAMTAFARPEDRERALRAGFDAHVAKPLEPALLVATIARLASA